MVFDGLSINLELWDTAGQEGYKQIRPLAYTNVRSLNLIDCSKLIFQFRHKTVHLHYQLLLDSSD